MATASESKPQSTYTSIIAAINKKLKKKQKLARISKALDNDPNFDINTVDEDAGRTILHHLCRKGLTYVLDHVLKSKQSTIDINIQSKAGQSALIETVIGHHESLSKFGKFTKSTSKSNPHDECIELLLKHGCNTELKSSATGWTALHEAVWQNYQNGAILLLKHGADINAVSIENETPLYLGVMQRRLSMCRMLLDINDIDVNIPAYKKYIGLETPLFAAARHAQPQTNTEHDFFKIFDLLLQRNAYISLPQSIIEQHQKDDAKMVCYTAIEHAREKGRWEVASKLLLHSLGQRLGEQVMNTKQEIAKDRSIVRNMMKIYDMQFGAKPDDYVQFKRNIILSVITGLENRQPLSKDLLLLAWKFNLTNEVQDLSLWDVLKGTCLSILTPPTKKFDFWFFRDNILNSSIWFEKYNDRVLYEELMEIVDHVSKNEQQLLSKSLLAFTENDDTYWTKLRQFTYTCPVDNDEKSDKQNVDVFLRQDANFSFKQWTKSGLQTTHKAAELDSVSMALGHNITRYYDNKMYLPRLRFVAYLLNNDFQKSMREIMSKSGISCTIQGGPLKTMERCLIKTETDYERCRFPKTAKLLDVSRCSLTFASCKDLYDGLLYLVAQIESQSTGFKMISRVKNTLAVIDINKPSYGDIKVNAVFDFDQYCLVVEIQMLLASLLKFKKRNHEIYKVKRKEEFYQNVVYLRDMIHPEHSIFSAAAIGDIDMIYQTLKYDDIDINLCDAYKGETPLFHAVRNNEMKAVKLLIEHGADANVVNSEGAVCLYSAAGRGYFKLVEYLVIGCKADVNGGTKKKCPVSVAAFHNYFEIVKLLVENGGFIETAALSLARRNHDIWEYLEEHKEDK
eukprot:212722_1